MLPDDMYDGDTPWDLLMHSVAALEEHAATIRRMIEAHNEAQRQINRAARDIHNLNKRITRLEKQINEIS